MKFFLLILVAGLFFRSFKPLEFFMYGHDQDLAGWIIKDILENRHLRLIGQETSSQGVFIGPLYYYLQIPFYLLFGMDPKGPLLLSFILGAVTIYSFYYVFKKVFSEKVGLIASLVYALSVVIIFTDREVAPTQPVMLWSVWFFYSLWLLLKGKQIAYIMVGILAGLIWHLNLGMAVLMPLVLFAQLKSKTKIDFKKIMVGIFVFLILFSPFIVFEFRHNYQQVNAIKSSLTTEKGYVPGTEKGFGKLDRVRQLVQKNTASIYWGNDANVPSNETFTLFIIAFCLLFYFKKIPADIAIVAISWQLLYVLFFTFNSINVSEYYLNGMNVIWIMILALSLNSMLESKNLMVLGYMLIAIFIFSNVSKFFTREVNQSGYIQRNAAVDFIQKDAAKHNYPCLAVSYITSPGNDLGYRYLYWMRGMRVEQSKSGAPVYTIVYPLSKVSRVDHTFGVIGLVLPDYERYNSAGVAQSCSGGNSNLTDPMFGYTE